MNRKNKEYWDYFSFFVFSSSKLLRQGLSPTLSIEWLAQVAPVVELSANKYNCANADCSYAQERLSALILVSDFN